MSVDRRKFFGYLVGGVLTLSGCSAPRPTPEDFKFSGERSYHGGRVIKNKDGSELRLLSEGAGNGIFYMPSLPILITTDFRALEKVKLESTIKLNSILLKMSATRIFHDRLLIEALIFDPQNSKNNDYLTKTIISSRLEAGGDCSILWENWKFQELGWNGTYYNLVTGGVRTPHDPVPTPTRYPQRPDMRY